MPGVETCALPILSPERFRSDFFLIRIPFLGKKETFSAFFWALFRVERRGRAQRNYIGTNFGRFY